jgi:hypothetical protein
MPLVKYRMYARGLPPQPAQMPVPGWAGEAQPRADGSHEQVWHCAPFSEGVKYGLELLYPFEQELRVRTEGGKVVLEADWGDPPGDGLMWPPFRPFGEIFYSYQLVLDLKVDAGWAIHMGPHPRMFSDPTDTTPVAVPALVRTEWWPMMYFMIFKAPAPGGVHIFRQGEPMAHILVIPAEPDLQLEPMDEEEAAERELRARRLHASRETLGEGSKWLSSTQTVFDGTYRHMLRAAKTRDRQG